MGKANLAWKILEEVRRPPGDETRVLRRGAKITILMVWFFYIMVNVSLVSAHE